ncbi:hypothetical protein D6D10_07253, partial [Aureobasidium pullulans]
HFVRLSGGLVDLPFIRPSAGHRESKNVHPSCVHPLKHLLSSSTAADSGILARVEPPFQSLAGLHDCRRLQQDILAHTTIVPGPLHFSSQPKQTCAQKLSMSSNAVTSKWTWLPALHQESQNVPILKTKRSTMTNVVQIAEDDKVRLSLFALTWTSLTRLSLIRIADYGTE